MTDSFTPREKRMTLAALLVVFLLSALDQTIVSTAMPKIIEHLHGLELYAWVTTAYMLSSTVMVPLYGKLSDLYGRKPILLTGVTLFLTGSALCGLSGEFGDLPLLGSGMTQLVVFRALQGVGGAALFSSTFSIIADLFSPRERGKYMGIFGGIFGLAGAIGPLIGGFFTDHGTVSVLGTEIEGWRWVFYVNLPLGLFSLFMIVARMPKLSHRAVGKVDYVGAVLFLVAAIPFLLALTWGGHTYPWDSARVVGLFALSAVSLALFLAVEMRVGDPMLPLTLFRNRVFTVANFAGFLTGMAFLGVVMFLPLFTQLVQGVSATKSGLTLLPIMLGMIFTASGSGFLVTRTGQYKPFIIGGTIVLMVGLIWLSGIGPDTTPLELSMRMFVVGLGLGPSQSLYNIAVQNAVPVNQIGIATGASQFFRQMGSVVGLAIFGTILTHNLIVELPKHMPNIPGVEAGAAKMDLSQAQAQAMDPDTIRVEIEKGMDARYQQIERAFDGDGAAKDALVADPAMPEQLKSILAKRAPDASLETPGTQQLLGLIKNAMHKQAVELAPKVERGVKEGFSISITNMFGTSLWIILAALLITLFIPVLPLRNTSPAQERAARAAAAAE